MPPAVYVHIGAFKTGTSFVQSRLWSRRAELAADGVLFPGEHGWGDQVRALSHLAGRPDNHGQPVPAEPWHEMVTAIRDWPGRAAVLSFEFLSLLRPRTVRRLVEELSPADVHVVLTARDLVRVVPAMWQEVLQGGQTWSWAQYCATVTSAVGRNVPPGRGFWRGQDLPGIVRRWAPAVPVQRIHVVTVPPAGAPREELWRRFSLAVGIASSETGGAPPDDRPGGQGLPNESLDAASTELMRRINLAVEGRMSRETYDKVLKFYVAKTVLAARAGPDRVSLSAEHVRWARERGAQMAADLRRLGVDVVGDLDDLVGSDVLAVSSEPQPDEVLQAAIAVIEALARRVGDPRRRAGAAPVPAAPVDAPEPTPSDQPEVTIGSRPVSRLVRTAYERVRR